MVRIHKGDCPDVLKSENCRKRVQKNIAEKRFAGNYYGKEEVKNALNADQHGKCCYCEKPLTSETNPEVEHFRPKNSIAEDQAHSGYYWLGHEWENLLYSCRTCNAINRKGTKFPIKGTRLFAPVLDAQGGLDQSKNLPTVPPLSEEQAYFIHPAYEDPEPHFAFRANGKMLGLTDRGQRMIQDLKLNRGDLVKARKDEVDDKMQEIKILIVGYDAGILGIDSLKLLLTPWIYQLFALLSIPEQAYSRYLCDVITNWERSILPKFPEEIHPMLRDLFNQ